IFFFLQRKFKNKVIDIPYQILAFPFTLFFAIATIGIPFLMLQLHLFYYLGLCFTFPMIIYQAYEAFGNPIINTQLKVYLIVTFAVMCSVLFRSPILWFVHKFSPARLKTSEKLRPYNLDELSNYLISENNIKFVIFTLYFILIVFINFYSFQDSSYYET